MSESNGENKNKMWTLIGCLVAAVALCYFIATRASNADDRLKDLQLAVGYGVLIVVFFFGFVIVADLITGDIDLSKLLTESGGGASMSRFQLLVFTFVIGLSLFFIVVGKKDFPSEIPSGILTLLGISATTYGVSKGIQGAGGLESKDGSDNGDGGANGNGNGNGATAGDKAAADKAAAGKGADKGATGS
jgi:hypothetical protein